MAYAITLTGKWMLEKFETLSTGNVSEEVLDSLPEIHASSAGLKALSTLLTSEGLEDCRKCCGGNGYLLSSGVSMMMLDYAWQVCLFCE